MAALTVHRLRELLTYSPTTGLFTWKVTLGSRAAAGDTAGCLKTDGYILIRVDRFLYRAHRLAWLYVHGAWPDQIDHRNGIRSDNRLVNLRATNSQGNAQNKRKAQSNSRSGLLGASPSGNKWAATIHTGGKKFHLGYFFTPEEAHRVYLHAKQLLHPVDEVIIHRK